MKEYESVKLNFLGKWLFRPKANSKLRPLYEQKMLEIHKDDHNDNNS